MDNAAEKKNQKKKTVNLTAERVIFSIAMILSVVSAAAVLLLTAQKSSQQLTVIASVLFCVFGICSVLSYIKMRADEQKKREKESADMAMALQAMFELTRKVQSESDQKMNQLNEEYAVPAEEIVNAIKALAKVTIGRSRENADAQMNSNTVLSSQLTDVKNDVEKLVQYINDPSKQQIQTAEAPASNTEDIKKISDSLDDVLHELKRMDADIERLEQSQKSLVEKPPVIIAGSVVSGSVPKAAEQPVVQEKLEQTAPIPDTEPDINEPENETDLNSDLGIDDELSLEPETSEEEPSEEEESDQELSLEPEEREPEDEISLEPEEQDETTDESDELNLDEAPDEELSLDEPSQTDEGLDLDEPAADDELSLETPSEEDELDLDDSQEADQDLSLDVTPETDDGLSLDDSPEDSESVTDENSDENELSLDPKLESDDGLSLDDVPETAEEDVINPDGTEAEEDVTPDQVIEEPEEKTEDEQETAEQPEQLEPEPQPVPTVTPISNDPNAKLSPEDIAKLFASANNDDSTDTTSDAASTDEQPSVDTTPAANADPNRMMTPEEIEALFSKV
ncbi:MAG: hypothetical protein SOY96_08660 [Lachnospiraceae bacterium]|nr:hypothetical protein [Lachnospiraceae bacterium]